MWESKTITIKEEFIWTKHTMHYTFIPMWFLYHSVKYSVFLEQFILMQSVIQFWSWKQHVLTSWSNKSPFYTSVGLTGFLSKGRDFNPVWRLLAFHQFQLLKRTNPSFQWRDVKNMDPKHVLGEGSTFYFANVNIDCCCGGRRILIHWGIVYQNRSWMCLNFFQKIGVLL